LNSWGSAWDFTPLVFSATGGMADQAIVTFIFQKRNEHYAIIMGWIKCCLSFSLLQSVIMVIALLPVDLPVRTF